MIKIFIVDDHQVVRDALRKMLSECLDLTIIGEAANGIEALERISTLLPDIVITNIKMPGIDGLELTRLVKTRWPECKVIILTLYDQYPLQAKEAGASAYLLKDIKSSDLISTINDVMEGKQPDASLLKVELLQPVA